MSPKHTFTVSGRDYPLADTTVLSTLAIVMLESPPLKCNPRVLAIKALRANTGMGLYEAKQIVDFIADRASLTETGEVTITEPERAVSYRCVR